MSKAKITPLEREDAREIFERDKVLAIAHEKGWLQGHIRIEGNMIPFYNADGLIEMLQADFRNEQDMQAIISMYWNGKKICSGGAPALLYNRDKIADKTALPVLILEDVKQAKAAEVMTGLIPVTWNGKRDNYKKVDWTILKNREVLIYPNEDDQGIEIAFEIKKKLPHAKVKHSVGIPISKFLATEGKKPDDLQGFIVDVVEMEPPKIESPIDTKKMERDSEAGFLPFQVLGIADDGKAYFIGRHERLASMALGAITQNKLLTLGSLSHWQVNYGTSRGITRDDWIRATDDVIEESGKVDFDPDRMRGRGAWREKDGRLCYHDGLNTRGEISSKRLYLRMTRKDIGLDSPFAEKEALGAILDVVGQLSFETRADMIRCISWATLAPFAGALPWRPAGLLTGRSESGKSTIVNKIIAPLSLPLIFSGGESTEAGIRQDVSINAVAIVVDEAEGDTDKKRRRRNDTLSLMRQSTSDEAPKVAKGTIDGKGMRFTMRSMFLFAAINPEVEAVADDNRMFLINLEGKGHSKEEWYEIEKKLTETITPDVCASIRALTWDKLKDIFALADRMSPVIQKITGKSSRFATADSLLFSAYQTIWKQAELSDDDLVSFFEQIYEWQPPEETRNETEELLDRLLDEVVREGKDSWTLRQVLQNMEGYENADMWKNIAAKNGLSRTPDGHLAIAKNHHKISEILSTGRGYQRQFFRHPKLVDKGYVVNFGGKNRNCVAIHKDVLNEYDGEAF
jgi:hypothetical protein